MSDDLRHPALSARVRNISDTGVEIVLGSTQPLTGSVAFSLAREGGHIRQAEIVWQRDRNMGLRFAGSEPQSGDLLDRFLGEQAP